MAGTVLATLYLGGLAWFLMAIRVKHSKYFSGSTMVVLMILLVVKFTDIGAYFGGRAFGRHKLIVWLSPGKTWEGAIGMTSTMGKIHVVDGAYPCEIKIDPGKEPKQIDILKKDKKGERTILGIYEIKGDTLKVCFYASDTGRRTIELSTNDNRSVGLIVLTRAKK